MTGLWWADIRDAHPVLRTLLTATEAARMRSYRKPADQARHLVAWALCRVVLGDLLGCAPASVPITRSCLRCGEAGHGKPGIDGRGPRFSLSHAGDRVVVAVCSDSAVGVDVEVIGSADDGIEALARAPSEEPVSGQDVIRRWVRKEAVLKATGHGLLIPMDCFAVTSPRAAPRLLSWPGDPGLPARMAMRDLETPPGYAAALAVIGPVGEVARHDGSAILARQR